MPIDWNLVIAKLLDNLPAIIGAVFTGLAVLIGAVSAFLSVAIYQKQLKATKERIELSTKVDSYHRDVNGKMEQLLNVSAAAAHAEGVLEQKMKGDETARVLAEEVAHKND
jgi:hypothetical protein